MANFSFGLPGVFLVYIVEFLSEQYSCLLLGLISIFLVFYSFLKPDLRFSYRNYQLYLIHKIIFVIFIFLIGILNEFISSGTWLVVTILLIKTFGRIFCLRIAWHSLTKEFFGIYLRILWVKFNKLFKFLNIIKS